jgi:hypothetical protein
MMSNDIASLVFDSRAVACGLPDSYRSAIKSRPEESRVPGAMVIDIGGTASHAEVQRGFDLLGVPARPVHLDGDRERRPLDPAERHS